MGRRKARVTVNGVGLIGERIADAVTLQDDMNCVGAARVLTDYRIRVAVERLIRSAQRVMRRQVPCGLLDFPWRRPSTSYSHKWT